jgi:hypothetical protein
MEWVSNPHTILYSLHWIMHTFWCCQDNVVGMATHYRLDGPGIESRRGGEFPNQTTLHDRGHRWLLCSSRYCLHCSTQSCINLELAGLRSTGRTASLVTIQQCGCEQVCRSIELVPPEGLQFTMWRHQASPTRSRVMLDVMTVHWKQIICHASYFWSNYECTLFCQVIPTLQF